MAIFERTSYHDQLSIDTPEQVELNYSVAGIGSRFVALLLDKLLTYLVYGALILVLILVLSAASVFNQAMDKLSMWVLAVLVVVYFVINWGYLALFEAYWHGQTPGKRAMKLRVIKDSGRQITLFESMARNLLRFVDELPGFFLVGVVTMMCNKKNKRLGDFVAGTLVVHERSDEQPLMFQSSMNFSPAAFPQGDPEPWREVTPGMFPADAVARLSGQDLMVIETFFGRMLDLPLETRAALAYRMAEQMAAKMGVTLPEETNPERALESMAYQMRSGGR